MNVHTVKGLANEKSRFLEIKLEQFYKESNSVQIFSIDDICEGVDMDIRFEKGISKNNSLVICEWSNEKGEEFQKQWMD